MKLLVPVFVLAFAAVASAEEAAAPPARTWIDFESTDGSFSISLPGQPAEKVTETPIGTGTVKTTTYTLNLGPGGFYFVSYTDNVSKPADAFDSVQKELAKQGTVLEKKDITLDGAPGREISLEMTAKQPGDILTTVRVFAVGGRLYQVLTTHQKATTSAADQKRFLDSFKVLKK